MKTNPAGSATAWAPLLVCFPGVAPLVRSIARQLPDRHMREFREARGQIFKFLRQLVDNESHGHDQTQAKRGRLVLTGSNARSNLQSMRHDCNGWHLHDLW